MDKKTGIIAGVLVVMVLALIGWAFMADSNDSNIVIINDVGYEKDGFEKYYKVKYFEELQNTKNSEDAEEVNKDELKNTAINEYVAYVIVKKDAKNRGFELSADAIASIEQTYDAEEFDRDTLTNLGISREDYIEARKLVETYNYYTNVIDEYYEVPQSVIDSYLEESKDELKGYDFRIMQFNITTTEATTNEDGEEVPATSNKDEIVTKAQAILDRVKAGEDFEALAKENADSRFAFTNSELKQVNGELESIDLPYLQSYLMFSCPELEEPLKALTTPGEYTELVTTDSYVAFARLEAVRDEIEEETRQALEKSVAQSVASAELSSALQSSSVIINNKLLKSINI